MRTSDLRALLAAEAAREPVVLITPLQSEGPPPPLPRVWRMGEPLDAAIVEAAEKSLREDHAQTIESAFGPLFLKPFNPPARLFLIGAVHIALPLSQMAKSMGYEVTLVDPRAAFARKERFPEMDVECAWPDEVLTPERLDRRTAVVALTHDPKIDDPALTVALQSKAFYIGALGSRKTHASRLQRLAEHGFNEATLARIFGPVGLAIGAISPAEIAISILAQITTVRRRGAA